jgi:hypothetical protein
MPPGRNDRCYCGSGKKYKKCHLEVDRDAERALREALPALREMQARFEATDRTLRDQYGVYINYVKPTQWQGGKVWAIRSRVYANRPPNETFHEFLIYVLRETFGEPWRVEQAALPDDEQHFVLKVSNEYAKWKAAKLDPEALERDGVAGAYPNGWVQYFLSLAWDVASLIHASNLSDSVLNRLRNAQEFQGARYEIAVAAIFARLDCEIRFLNDDESLRGEKHVEFVATHRPSGQQIAVETKSRRRPGVVNEPGEIADDPLRGDPRAVRQRFMEALEQAPDDMPFMVFIDINAPLEPDAMPLERSWVEDIKRWMGRMPAPSADAPDKYNALCVTNFAPHYQGDDLASGGEWLAIKPLFTTNPLNFDLTGMLDAALNNYHRVPEITEDGRVRE